MLQLDAVKVRHLLVDRFRGIARLEWVITRPLVCLVGRGDSTKSTILDAIEYTLTSRWVTFTDADFHDCRTDQPIVIEVTVGELPRSVLPEGKFGFHLRGWSTSGELHDEPMGDDEAVVTIRLTVDASLEPVWELTSDRGSKTLSSRDRALLPVSRLGQEVDRHLGWAPGAALTKATGDTTDAAAALIEGHRQARDAVANAALDALRQTARETQEAARNLGAYSSHEYRPGLDPTRVSASAAPLVLQEGNVPLRLAGLGTRRLVAIALQRQIAKAGALVLVDEIEHGLEPHRLRHLLSALRADFEGGCDTSGTGQVIFTTHAPTTIVEIPASALAVTRTTRAREVTVRHATDSVQAAIRLAPEAFLSRRVIVCEGKTEIGFLRAMKRAWAESHGGEPIEHRGVALAHGGGNSMASAALAFLDLGYETALLADSDVKVDVRAFLAAGGRAIQWAGGLAIEQRFFRDVPVDVVDVLIAIAIAFRTEQAVVDGIRMRLGLAVGGGPTVATWRALGKNDEEIRAAIGFAAHGGSWFKRIDAGEEIGEVVALALPRMGGTDLSEKLAALEAWTYV